MSHDGKMRTTRDTFSGKPFRWNAVDVYEAPDGRRIFVPARYTSRTSIWLHPTRTPARLLAELNPLTAADS